MGWYLLVNRAESDKIIDYKQILTNPNIIWQY